MDGDDPDETPFSFKKRTGSNGAAQQRFTSGNRNTSNSFFRRVSGASRKSRNFDPFDVSGNESKLQENAKVPSLLPAYDPPDTSTPLPTIPILVLCICMLGEFLSAATPAAFMYFMIESFYTADVDDPPEGIEAQVAFVNGIVSSVFFLAQFLTSLLWASIAQKHGRRVVLAVSLLGNACSLTLFGTSKNVPHAAVARFAQGVFAGAVGVARGAVRDVTDPTNEARAYTLIGLSWGLGGIAGPIIGGLTEHPTIKFPRLFANNQLLNKYPYLLPCILSSCFTFSGSVLCLFLNRDGGPRFGAIQLPLEKEVEDARSALPRRILNRFSSYLSTPSKLKHVTSETSDVVPGLTESPANTISLRTSPVKAAPITMNKYKQRGNSNQYGTSYGQSVNATRGWSQRRYTNTNYQTRRNSIATSNGYAPDYDQQFDESNLNFAQRLLLANEASVFSISDLWVSAAKAVDDQYSQMDWIDESEVFDEEDEEGNLTLNSRRSVFSGSEPPSLENLRMSAQAQDSRSANVSLVNSSTPNRLRAETPEVGNRESPIGMGKPSILSPRNPRMVSSRRNFSTASRPAIFNNTGLPESALPNSYSSEPAGGEPALSPILEYSKPQLSPAIEASPIIPFPPQHIESSKSPLWQLPLGVILQLFTLAFHGVACDQIFMTFLVTPVPSGGLGLTAAHYSQLVAAMVFFSMTWQFKVYPALGPPNGRFSHLAMLRFGLCLYIPVYICFPTLRSLNSDSTNAGVMFGMIFLSAFRYLGNVCAYTSIMVLTNALSPPHLLVFANGLAQSAASAARFCGPIVGGYIWSWSIAQGPTARAWPFDYHFAFYVVACVCLCGILLSFKIA